MEKLNMDEAHSLAGSIIRGIEQHVRPHSRICEVSPDGMSVKFIVKGKGVPSNECCVSMDLERDMMEFQVVRLAWGDEECPVEWYRTQELLFVLNLRFAFKNPFYTRQNGKVEAPLGCFHDIWMSMPPLDYFCENVADCMIQTAKG
jgi:hypothetical protein